MNLDEQIGQHLVIGIPGTVATPEIIQQFKDTHAGGLILFRTNFESATQLRKLISDLEQALGRSLLICTDHEGGRVVMFGEETSIFPSNQAIGKTGNTQYARLQGEQEARELRRLGIDVSFSPVVDVLTSSYSPNIGIRAYGSDADLVAKMGAARLSALQVEGISAVAKHFPGLGAAGVDPHEELPTVNISLDELQTKHLVPFERAMRTNVHGIMSSHGVYPQIDNTPATFSKKLIKEMLRGKTGYKGVVFTDDLEMGALKKICSVGEAAVRALEAGHDMVLVCHDLSAEKEAYSAIKQAYATGRLTEADLQASLKRIEMLKGRRYERFAALPATELRAQKEKSDVLSLIQTICTESVTVLQEGPSIDPSKKTAILFPSIGSLASKVLIEPALQKPEVFIQQTLTGAGSEAAVINVPLDPSESDIQTALNTAQSSDQIVLFVYDAHALASNKELLTRVQATGKPLVVVLMRDVYDLSFVAKNTRCLTNYGYRACDIQTILQTMFERSRVAS